MGDRRLVVAVDDGYDSYDQEAEILAGVGAAFELRPCAYRLERVLEAVRDADAVLVRECPLPAQAIEAMTRCRAIVRYGIGVDNIDREGATRRRIVVANVPDYGTEEVSDQALALTLGVARRVAARDRAVRAGAWKVGPRERMYRIAGKTLGLVGYGRIARAYERKMRGAGVAHVLVHDPYAELPAGVEACDMDTLCRASDIVSLHAPLVPQTRHILDARRLALLKPTAIVVNTARGGLVDEAALVAALQAGRLLGAGLDVYEDEPPRPGHPLFALDNAVLSDHTGWYSEESVRELQRKAAEEVARILRGEPPRHWVNPWS